MACFYCFNEDVKGIPDVGDCVECKRPVCIEGARPPNRHHATQCTCRCGQLVCRIDYKTHSSKYPSTPSHCFGKDAAMLGTEALSGIEMISDTPEHGPARQICVDTVNRFLNFIAPGRDVLQRTFAAEPGGSSWEGADDERMPIMIPHQALPPGGIAPLVPLIVRETTIAWKRLDDSERSDPWFIPVIPLLDTLADAQASPMDLFATADVADAISPRLALLIADLRTSDWQRPFRAAEWLKRMTVGPSWSELAVTSNSLPVTFSKMPVELELMMAGSSHRTA